MVSFDRSFNAKLKTLFNAHSQSGPFASVMIRGTFSPSSIGFVAWERIALESLTEVRMENVNENQGAKATPFRHNEDARLHRRHPFMRD